jgi:hypothetical protein
MPVTPFHIVAGLLFKAYAPARVSWVVFALVNVLIDLEPILWYLLTADPAHRQLHSYLGAAIVAAIGVWPGRMLAEAWLRWWNRQLNPSQARWLRTGTRIPLPAAWVGALLGSGSHIMLDSFMHPDMQPFWPWAADNSLLQQIPVDGLHAICLAAAVWGGLRLAILVWIKLPATVVGNTLRDAIRLVEIGLVATVGMIAVFFLIMPLFPESDRRDAVAFDPAVWSATEAAQFRGNPRARMARPAVRYLETLRPTRAAALVLLGPPDARERPTYISYHLGFLGWIAMDTDTLDIEFQPDGTFVAARIVQH